MQEKRKLKRRYMLAEVKIRPSGSEKWIQAVLLNINRGGIGLYAMESLKKGQPVTVRIIFLEKNKLTTAEELPGVVRWVQQIGAQFGAGIMFTAKVNRAGFPALARCLEYAKNHK